MQQRRDKEVDYHNLLCLLVYALWLVNFVGHISMYS